MATFGGLLGFILHVKKLVYLPLIFLVIWPSGGISPISPRGFATVDDCEYNNAITFLYAKLPLKTEM